MNPGRYQTYNTYGSFPRGNSQQTPGTQVNFPSSSQGTQSYDPRVGQQMTQYGAQQPTNQVTYPSLSMQNNGRSNFPNQRY